MMGAGSSHDLVQQGPIADLGTARARDGNALGLSGRELADIRHLHGLLARDTSAHCVRAHIKFFRKYPEHLERFCGRQARAEPMHYAPVQLQRDSEFTARALMHGLAQLQALRCSCSGDMDLMAHQVAGIARAHRGLGLTRETLRNYRDVLIGYLASAFPQAMTHSTRASWSTFLTTLTDSLCEAIESHERTPAASSAAVQRMAWTSSWLERFHKGSCRGKLMVTFRSKAPKQMQQSCKQRETSHLSKASSIPCMMQEDTERERDEGQNGSEALTMGMSASCLTQD